MKPIIKKFNITRAFFILVDAELGQVPLSGEERSIEANL
jgi:hypothetical protein